MKLVACHISQYEYLVGISYISICVSIEKCSVLAEHKHINSKTKRQAEKKHETMYYKNNNHDYSSN